ncbi:MAG TPA: sigma 54-interacting transcriptional regulator [Kofleriaceae bacterium]|nr:sigma 54-interacting transcriptional regulator [Kofleriaceae bacterium]
MPPEPGAPDPSRLVLRVLTDGALLSFPLPREGRVVIGRGRDATLRVDHASLSRNHAALWIGASPTLEDLGSQNGTRIGERVLAANTPVPIALDQPIHLGNVLVLVQRGAPAVDAEPVAAHDTSFGERMRPIVERIAQGRISVLLLGETGAGKEVMARAVHRASPRADRAFVAINCAAVTESLLESELFGYERGAFTGALAAKPGLIESADGGTLFLDEVGELPLALQAKLLRVLEERAVQRIGALRPTPVDIRVIAATNRDLEAEVARGRFRTDLYFRLAGFSLTVPPLRDRKDEIPALVDTFVREAAGDHAAPALTAEAMAALAAHAWPGNIRELRNVIERAVLLAQGAAITPVHLQLSVSAARVPVEEPAVGTLRDQVKELERQRIVDALAQCGGNQSRAAKLLGISRPTLIRRMEAYGLPRPRQ